jgi:hypothetical protein
VTPSNDDTAVLAPVAADEPEDRAEDRADDLAAELAKAAPRRWWNRGTLVLGALVLLVGGFLGGTQVQKHWGATATATGTNRPAGGAGQNRAAGGFAGLGGAQGGAAPTASAAPAGTAGTVKLVDGNTIYVQTADGTVVTVKIDGKTAVRTASKASVKDVKTGDTVTVQGGAGTDGTVTATAVTADRK